MGQKSGNGAIKLGYNTSGFSRSTDLLSVLETIRGTGFVGVELTIDRNHYHPDEHDTNYLEKIRDRCEKLELELVLGAGGRHALGETPHRPTLVTPDPDERRLRRDHLEKAIEAAELLGTNVLTFHSGPKVEGIEEEDAWGYLSDDMAVLCERAENRGILLAVEYHPDMFIHNLARYRQLFARVGSPVMRLNLDIGHVRVMEEEPIPKVIEDTYEETVNVHLEDIKGRVHEHLPIGDGDIDFGDVLRTYRNCGYERLICAEFHSRAIDIDEAELCRRTWNHLSKFL